MTKRCSYPVGDARTVATPGRGTALNREETFDSLCVLLEDYDNTHMETTAEHILDYLEITGEDLLDHLDPPVGLRRWLDSHGLSLVVTREVTPPVVWEAIQEEDEEGGEEAIQEGELGESLPLLEVGGYVEYRTAPSGPHGQSKIGSGTIIGVDEDGVEVESGPGMKIILFPGTDFIRLVSP
jgi:hypothetical protein